MVGLREPLVRAHTQARLGDSGGALRLWTPGWEGSSCPSQELALELGCWQLKTQGHRCAGDGRAPLWGKLALL